MIKTITTKELKSKSDEEFEEILSDTVYVLRSSAYARGLLRGCVWGSVLTLLGVLVVLLFKHFL